MDNPVKIKADANGLIVQLPGEMDFLRIYRLTVKRFTMSAELFSKCGNISIRFIGADLNELQKTWLIDSLNSLDCINTHFIQYKLKKEPVPVESKFRRSGGYSTFGFICNRKKRCPLLSWKYVGGRCA